MRLILARHGETQLNKDGRFQGVDDEPLNATGRAQAAALAEGLAKDTPFYLYASPIPRALETAQIVSDRLNSPINALDGLKELHIGELAGLNGAEMRQRYPDFVHSWTENAATAQLPGGETVHDVQQRAWRAIKDLQDKHPDETVVAVSHNFTILSIIAKALDIELRNFRRLKQDLCGIARLELTDSRLQVHSLNETWHLRQLNQT